MQCVRQTVNVLVSVAFCLVVAMAVCAMDSVALPKNWEEMEMMYHSGFNDALLHLLDGWHVAASMCTYYGYYINC